MLDTHDLQPAGDEQDSEEIEVAPPAESTDEVNATSTADAGVAGAPMQSANPVMRMIVGLVGLLIVAAVVWIFSAPEDPAGPAGQAGVAGQGADGARPETLEGMNPFLSTGPPRETLEGNWVLIISQPDEREGRFDEICSGLFILAPRRGNLDDMTVRLAFRTQVFPDAELVAEHTTVSRKTARIIFEQAGQRVDFEGALDSDGIVYGNVVRGDVCQAARLMPTDQVELDQEIAVMSTLDRPKLDAVVNEAKAKKLSLYDTYRMFCKKHSDTSLALDISLKNLMPHSKPRQMPLKVFQAAVQDHLELTKRWGDRMPLVHTLILSHVTFNNGYPPQAAISLAEGVSEKMGEAEWATPFQRRMEELLDQCRGTLLRIEAEDVLKQLASKSTTDKETPLAKLKSLHEKYPFSHFVTFGLAEQAEKEKRIDEAIGLYGEIVAWPLLERLLEFDWEASGVKGVRPGDTLAKLWKQKHGDTKGLPAFLEQTYDGAIDRLVKDQTVKPPADATRSVLCELFTSVRADAAVAAELSTAALARHLGADHLIVVRYHPMDSSRRNQGGGDPLANDAALNRLAYYSARRIPEVVIDGARLPSIDGLMADIPRVNRGISRALSSRMAIPSEWTITLAATQTAEGAVEVTCQAAGKQLADEESRLRLLLVEPSVSMPSASNGVRVQEMVARWQIDGGDGVAPRNGRFSVSETLDIGVIRKQLADDLSRFERLQGMNFPVKPLELKRLHVVAVIQHEKTREVFQSKIVPVTVPAKTSN